MGAGRSAPEVAQIFKATMQFSFGFFTTFFPPWLIPASLLMGGVIEGLLMDVPGEVTV